MTRQLPDWLSAYVRYADVTEAPTRFHFWSGVSAIAAALRRKVWIDMRKFRWVPSFYIVFVAPPGIIAKSTTAGIAEQILRRVPAVKFGPNVVTWQRMAEMFSECCEGFMYQGEEHAMSPLTFISSELGSLINMQDRDGITLLIELWDGKTSHQKSTKLNGNEDMNAPWINILGCTTPGWIADNMPASTVGGGFTSRCIFLYADQKERLIPFVDEQVDAETDSALGSQLVSDLTHISEELSGPFVISAAARDWFRPWYTDFWKAASSRMEDKMAEGYAARKQTHMFKLAMILSVSQGDSLVIEQPQLELASTMLLDVEAEMPKVFSRIGRSETSLNAEVLVNFVNARGKVTYAEAYKCVHTAFPDARDFEGVIVGVIRSGQVAFDGLHLSCLKPNAVMGV